MNTSDIHILNHKYVTESRTVKNLSKKTACCQPWDWWDAEQFFRVTPLTTTLVESHKEKKYLALYGHPNVFLLVPLIFKLSTKNALDTSQRKFLKKLFIQLLHEEVT